jgi:ubiquinone/menaquinone biosynthesis C-methylase UbiE
LISVLATDLKRHWKLFKICNQAPKYHKIETGGGTIEMPEIFNGWPERYDQWFETPIGTLIREYESKLILEMLRPGRGEKILDVGCGTGIFTLDFLAAGADVVGLELSLPMILWAGKKLKRHAFRMVQGDMRNLPFADSAFEKTISVTAIEFIKDARGAVSELFRVTKPRGPIVVATLNRLSPWATRREAEGKKGHSLFRHAFFRSPKEISALSPVECIIKTAIHFQKHDDPEQAKKVERNAESKGLGTGAFLVARWDKPDQA